jgi:peptidyl-tRNA hydrolase, PTH1 family
LRQVVETVLEVLQRVLARLLGVAGRRPSDHGADPLVGLEPETTRVVVGLGNPGPEYADTRHNLGFLCVEALARQYSAVWHDRKSDLACLLAVIRPTDGIAVVLVKPLTFMNRSGTAVRAVLDRLGVPPDRCLIVYDDMDLPFGNLRLRERGSPGTHTGMRSVVASQETSAVPRLRIGISQASPGDAISHVLSEFAPSERDAIQDLVARAAAAALDWALHGATVAMNRYNKS